MVSSKAFLPWAKVRGYRLESNHVLLESSLGHLAVPTASEAAE